MATLSSVDAYLAVVSKREIRSYDQRLLAPDVVRRILDAGRLAGSSRNRQQRRFIVLQETKQDAARCVYAPDNVIGAALAVAIVVPAGAGELDAGRAAQNMMLAAWNDGVGSCPNGVADAAGLAHLLRLGDDEHVVILLSFGYPARARAQHPDARSPEEWIERADRLPLEEIVSWQ